MIKNSDSERERESVLGFDDLFLPIASGRGIRFVRV